MTIREAYIGFKGRKNSSSMLVKALSQHHILLTNSFTGIKKDIGLLPADYDVVYFFGVDKNLTDSFRIEQCAEKDRSRLLKFVYYSVFMSILYRTKVVQIWYKKEAGSAKTLSLRISKTTKSSIPVAGSKRSVRCFSFLCSSILLSQFIKVF